MSHQEKPRQEDARVEFAADRLESWKEIAAYLKRDTRTVQRWEIREGLPVHRHVHNKLPSVYAYKNEIDAWWKGGSERLEIEQSAEQISVVGLANEADSSSALPDTGAVRRRVHKWLWGTALSLLGLLGIAVSTIVWWHSGGGRPRSLQPLERRLTANSENAPVTGAAISPDGKYLAFSDKNGCYLRHIDSGETHPIPLPEGFIPQPASWFPDGLHLLVTRIAGAHEPNSLWTISIMGGSPRKLADQGRWPAVSPDGSQIVFAEYAEDGCLCFASRSRELWIMRADAQQAHKLLVSEGPELGFGPPAWSPDGRHIAFTRTTRVGAPFHLESQLEILDLASGKTEVVLRSSRVLLAVAWGKEGGLIYSTQEAAFSVSGDSSLWEVRVDPRTGQAVGNPIRLTTEFGQVTALNLSAKTGRLAFIRETAQPDIYISNLEGRGRTLSTPYRLTFDERDDYPFAWTSDSKSVIFLSNRNGPYQIFKQRLDHADAESLVGGDKDLSVPRLSPDGTNLIYISPGTEKASTRIVMRLPLSNGPPQQVLTGDGIDNFWCALAPATLCLFSRLDQKREIFSAFDPIKGSVKPIPLVTDEIFWSLSPDGEMLVTSKALPAYTNSTPDVPAINFISIKDFSSRTMPVPGWEALTGLDWSSDGRSVWVSAHDSDNSWAILNIDLNGRVRPVLREKTTVLGWAIPSPDGQHLAMWERVGGKSNVWMLENL